MATFEIMLAPGDGIGPEIVGEAGKVLHAVAERWGHRFHFFEEAVGAAAIDLYGVALRPETLDRARSSQAVLFGAVGHPRFDDPGATVRPEQAILGLRKGLGLYANLRPIKTIDAVVADSPLRPEIVRGTDLIIVRELTGGIYFGEPRRRWSDGEGRHAIDTMAYGEQEIRRILEVGFRLARGRRRRLTSVDKANVLDCSRLWREVAKEVARDFPDVVLEHVLVDSCAMHLVQKPTRFDVVVTENMFGDILTDEAAVLGGSLGMMPSASLGDLRPDGTGMGLYEPIHGSAPDIAGQGKANPIGTILSAAMMLRMSLGLAAEAAAIERAVAATLAEGLRTADIAGSGSRLVGTMEMGSAIAARVGTA